MTINDLTKIDTRGVFFYTERQNVALMALRGLLQGARHELKKHETVEDVNKAFSIVLYGIRSVYEVLLENVQELQEFNHTHGLDKYLQINSVALMALNCTIERVSTCTMETDKDDGILALELLLYDLDGIDSMLSENMEVLWQIKDKAAHAA